MDTAKRQVCIYVSSDFRDLRAERRVFAEVVYPALRDRASRHGVIVTFSDPCQGQSTPDKLSDTQLTNCILEIAKNERLYFLGLLGGRYGTVVTAIPPEVKQRPGYELLESLCHGEVSLMALEWFLTQGRAPETTRHLFYFREAGLLGSEYQDRTRLDRFKRFLKHSDYPIREGYRWQWDSANSQIVGLDDFARLLTDDLWALIFKDFSGPAAIEEDPEVFVVSLDDSDEDSSSEFELSLDGSDDVRPGPAEDGSDSEFELALDDDDRLSVEEGAADIFEATNFDVPALDDDSGSEAVALEGDSATDVEGSDFEISLDDDSRTGERGESAVVDLDEEQDADPGGATIARPRKTRSPSKIEEDVDDLPQRQLDDDEESEVGCPTPPHVDDNVQFTVYRPKVIAPRLWYPLLAFAHLEELPDTAPPNEPDPVAEVKRQAAHALGAQLDQFKESTEDSRLAVPREGEITFVPHLEGITFNPPRRTFLWIENVHREEFRLRATQELDGQTVKGTLAVYLGNILLAEITLSIRVKSGPTPQKEPPAEKISARAYRKIFASYSHKDVAIVEEFERYGRALGDTYLRDWVHLRSGEVWTEKLQQMIEEADVFQLFWSTHAMRSPFVEQEWRHALALNRPNFIRPAYWEDPLPTWPEKNLPPEDLVRLHFQRLTSCPPPVVESNEVERAEALAQKMGELKAKLSDASTRRDTMQMPRMARAPSVVEKEAQSTGCLLPLLFGFLLLSFALGGLWMLLR